jgi:succinate dehydrogenase/fumarate reductase flavoprotein subunit
MPGGNSVLACDLLVAGSGAAGLAAAVTAARAGLAVIVAEKAPVFGGTTSYSAGIVWVPASRQAQAAGKADSAEAAMAYLMAECGDRIDLPKAQAYLAQAPEVLAWLEQNTHLRFNLAPGWPDYHPELEGGSAGGRSLGPAPFDARRLGARFADLRPPLATMTILGGMMVGREDLPHFYRMTRSAAAARYVGRLFARYALDRLSHPRGTRLSNGNALVAALALSAFESGVRLMLRSPVTELLHEGGRVSGAVLDTADGKLRVQARAGVVLATGGFPADDALRARFYPHVAAGRGHRTAAPPDNGGDGFRLGLAAGVATKEDQKQPAAWTPVSLVPQSDGSSLPFPHFLDRGKAGYIAVDRRGRRFVSEARSYHDFVPAMVDACRDDEEVACHLICDSAAIARYGLGRSPPRPGRPGPHVRSGYLIEAPTIAALAAACGIDPAGLADTVSRVNAGAARGEDPEFGKGDDVYQRFNGSLDHDGPNPCVAPVAVPPFYAVRLVPGDIGTFIGLRTDVHGRALDARGEAMAGLYVAGNDAASFMGGTYPGAGITIGPALVFGCLAARHAAAALEADSGARLR